MKIKTLLLGTATAFAAVTGAQAADLAVAEPVDYVKVCDAYGAGYFYIPGSDTCLKIGGYVKGYVDFYDVGGSKLAGNNSTVINGTVSTPGVYPSNWNWTTETSINVTAQSMTDIGLLTGWIDYRAKRGNGSGGSAYIDSAYLKAGPVKIGYFTNVYYYGGQYGEYGAGGGLDAADWSSNQLVFGTSVGGMGFWLGVVDNRGSPGLIGTNTVTGQTNTALYTSSWPDIVAALTGTAGGFDWKLAAAATSTVYGTGWGAQLGASYTLASGDALRAKVAVGNSYGSAYVDSLSPTAGGNTIWSALIAGVHYWSSNVSTMAAASYTSNAGGVWNAGIETDWLVAKNFLTGVAVDYWSAPNPAPGSYGQQWQVELLAKRSF